MSFASISLYAADAELSQNLLPNGGFEDGASGWWSPDLSSFKIDPETVHSGQKSVRFDISPMGGYVSSSAKVSPSRTYFVSLFIKTEDVTPADAISVSLLQWDAKKPIGWWLKGGSRHVITTGGTHSWSEFRIRVEDLKPKTEQLGVLLQIAKVASGRVWFDDVAIREGALPGAVESEAKSPTSYELASFDNAKTLGGFHVSGHRASAKISNLDDGPGIRVLLDNREHWLAFSRFISPENEIAWRQAERIVFRTRSAGKPAYLSVFLRERSGAVWTAGLNVPGKSWQDISVPIASFTLGSWTKANEKDGKLTREIINRIDFVPPTGKRVEFDLRSIRLEGPFGEDVTFRLIAATPSQLLVFEAGKDIPLTLRLSGGRPGRPYDVSLEVLDFWGNVTNTQRASLVPDAEGKAEGELIVSGVGHLRARFTARDGQRVVGSHQLSIAALRKPSKAFQESKDALFGIWAAHEGLMRPIGARTTRTIIDMKWTWPSPNQRDEGIFQMAETWRKTGAQPIVCFRGFSRWASAAPANEDPSRYPPKDWAVWEEFVRWIVAGFKDDVKIWEVWNEPYPLTLWKGSRDDLLKLHAICYRTVKTIQPDGIVIGPCLNFTNRRHREELKALLDIGLAKYIDGLSDHPYRAGRVAPELSNFLRETRELKELIGRYGLKDIYYTEMGYSVEPGGNVTEREQAEFISRSFILSKVAGVCAMTWHNLCEWVGGPSLWERNYGIVHVRDEDGVLEPRPAYVAFGVTNRHLHDAVFRRELDFLGPTARGYVFERDKRPIVALWDFGERPRTVELDVGAEEVTISDLMDVTRRVKTADGRLRVKLDGSPIFIHGGSRAALVGSGRELISVEPEVLALFPGGKGSASLTVRNTFDAKREVTLDLRPPDGWEAKLSAQPGLLSPGAERRVVLRVIAPSKGSYGDAAIPGRLVSGGELDAPFVVRTRLVPPVLLKSFRPAFIDARRPAAEVGIVARRDLPEGGVAEILREGKSVARSPIGHLKKGDSRCIVMALGGGLIAIGSAATLRCVVSVPNSHPVSREERLSFTPCVRLRGDGGIKIDGKLDDWRTQNFIYFCDECKLLGHERWRNPHDLSASFATAWDSEHLYLAVYVADDVFQQDRAPVDVWQQDNVQLHVNPDPFGTFDDVPCFEYGLTLSSRGPEVFRWMRRGDNAPLGLVRDARFAGTRLDRSTIYEAAFDLRDIGRNKPLETGDRLGFAIAVNDSDGDGRKAISWFAGIVEGKMPELHGVLVLTEGE